MHMDICIHTYIHIYIYIWQCPISFCIWALWYGQDDCSELRLAPDLSSVAY